MNLPKKKKITIYILLVSVMFLLICWDFISVDMNLTVLGTFRLESDFDAVSSATCKVSIVPSDYQLLTNPSSRDDNLSYEQIEDMVKNAIALQGGLEWIIDAGDKVMIKVNLVGGNSPSGEGENTDVRVVKALIKCIADYTNNNVEIIVAEGTARTNDNPSEASSVWGNSGYTDLLADSYLNGINIQLLNLNQSRNDMIEVNLGATGTSAPQEYSYQVHKSILEADVYIAVPVLKIHDTGITNALKLQIGIAPGCIYGYPKALGTEYSDGIFHTVEHRIWTTEAIVDLSNIAGIDFVLVDAIMCLEREKVYKGDNQVRMNTIIAGADPVAVDHVSSKLLSLNPDDVSHISLAEKAGLGTNDPSKIIITGASINEVKKTFLKNQTVWGKFGQGNRTWILSQAFDGYDINSEYITNEAGVAPEPGTNNWSEPVYFFDDKIDLISYYNGATDITSYAFTYFDSPEETEAELWFGVQEAAKVYLNDTLIINSSSYNAFDNKVAVTDKKLVNLIKGQNKLLVKTINRLGDYSFTVNICEIESDNLLCGNRVNGLKFYTNSVNTSNKPLNQSNSDMLFRAYPNPATTGTCIEFEIPNNSKTNVSIHGMDGRQICIPVNKNLSAGHHSFQWNLCNSIGTKVEPGYYICTIQSGSYSNTIKIMVE